MRILVLGGTQMLGRNFVERNQSVHSIVLANRGVTLPDLFSGLEHVKIDRGVSGGCASLGMLGPVDVVVDFSCYTEQHLQNTVPFLPKYKRYVYVSTMSVFDADVLQREGVCDYYWYCVNKVQCEAWVRCFADREGWSVVRPCAVVGPHDYTKRFYERDGKYFWNNGIPAENNVVAVDRVSAAIERELVEVGFRELNVCEG